MLRSERVLMAITLTSLPIAAWAQRWEPAFPPNPSDSGHNFLMGVSTRSADDTWAVGYANVARRSGYDSYTLAVHWDGEDWSQFPTPSPAAGDGSVQTALYAVEIIGHDDVWAAGYKEIHHPDDGAIGTQLLVLHWDGGEWLEIEAPVTPAGGTGAFVRDILAIGPDDIWFVGMYNQAGGYASTGLAMHWDGSGFTVHMTPNFNINLEKNLAVSRAADGDLWIAGMHGRGGWGSTPYVYKGRDDAWELVASWTNDQYTDVQTVVAFADDDAWIGAAKITDSQWVGYVWLHWDGSSWAEHPVPSRYHEPHLVAGGPDDIYSAGEASLYHYDGSTWTLVDELVGVDLPNMNRIDLATDGSVFGAGRYFPGGAGDGRTLAARYAASTPCDADFNGDGTVNTADVLAFLNAWSSGDPRGDFNDDGTINTLDFLAFLNVWSAGC